MLRADEPAPAPCTASSAYNYLDTLLRQLQSTSKKRNYFGFLGRLNDANFLALKLSHLLPIFFETPAARGLVPARYGLSRGTPTASAGSEEHSIVFTLFQCTKECIVVSCSYDLGVSEHRWKELL